jgi:hypothetical protein
VEPHFRGWFLPDGSGLVLQGAEPGRPARIFVLELAQGGIRPLLPEGWTGGLPTPDGRFVVARAPGDRLPVLYPLRGGDPQSIPGTLATDVINQFGAGGGTAFVRDSVWPTHWRYVRLDLRTGRRTPWLDTTVTDPTGVTGLTAMAVHPSGRSYVYCYERVLSDLHMIESLK